MNAFWLSQARRSIITIIHLEHTNGDIVGQKKGTVEVLLENTKSNKPMLGIQKQTKEWGGNLLKNN